ncbi:hypothetical protein DDZ13_00705 [Coraliomargarita sinensis]|uniref:Outer membrane lipoprotein-sorting protein n=1 Tax=Coraliomargarita sinensis TaxID=2174842 RepID=A0A317ZIS0_9BACT|nr:hypothetical protein [Coraliomargarita sinensis]PXA05420.1 hypothetical protein DDZ13_00705 [Coraliomargarita sinensis]
MILSSDVLNRWCAFIGTWCRGVLLAAALSAGVHAQQLAEKQSYRESIQKLAPMNTEGLDSNLVHILNRYYKATFGGIDNWQTLESVRFDGRLHLENGVARFVAFKKKPDYCKMDVFAGGSAQLVMGYDGEDAWKINTSSSGAKPRGMSEKEARNFIRDASIGGPLLYPLIKGKTIELSGVEKVADYSCYKLVTTLPDGERIISYLDTSNYAERRQMTTNALTGLQEQTTYSDFRRVGGVRFPFAARMESGGKEVHRVEMQKIQLNIGMTPWMFQRPAEGYSPVEESNPDDVALIDEPEGTIPLGEGGFGSEGFGNTAFPDPESTEVDSILDKIGKPQR